MYIILGIILQVLFMIYIIMVCELIWLGILDIKYFICWLFVKIKKLYKELNENYKKHMKLVQEYKKEKNL